MGYPFPTTACVLSANASLPNVCKNMVWAQIVAPTTGANASAVIYDSSTSTAGKSVAVLMASGCTAGYMVGPFIPGSGLYLGNLTAGCVNIWVRPVSR